jgi:hypothetical protein
MTQEHPITPPPELVEDWIEIAKPLPQRPPNPGELATLAARWGANQELEACCEWLANARNHTLNWNEATNYSANLLHARRPKPPSLKEQALQALAHLENGAHCSMDTTESAHYIRRALESLPD